MRDKPVTPLRRRMLEDMALRKFGEKTQTDYIRQVERFARFLGRSPDTATADDLRCFQVHRKRPVTQLRSRFQASTARVRRCV